jgi:hypothetical protein
VRQCSISKGTSVPAHRYGGEAARLGRREIGPVHTGALVDIPFPRRVHHELLASGDAEVQHFLPDSGRVSRCLDRPEDVELVTAHLRRFLDLARNRGSPTLDEPAL